MLFKKVVSKLAIVVLISLICINTLSLNIHASSTPDDLQDTYANTYANYVLQNSKKRAAVASSLTDGDYQRLEEKNVDPVFYDFFTFFKGTDFSDLYNCESGKISLSETLNTPVLFLAVDDTRIMVQIGEQKYYIINEIKGLNKSVNLVTEDGKTTNLYYEQYDIEFEYSEMPDAFKMARASWLSESSGIKGKTGGWLTCIAIVVDAAGWVATFTGNIVGGIITQVVGTALLVGELYYQTYYTITYQSRRSDCQTYIRERKVFYQYSNYTNYLKTTYSYFHSVNPDYVGGACVGY